MSSSTPMPPGVTTLAPSPTIHLTARLLLPLAAASLLLLDGAVAPASGFEQLFDSWTGFITGSYDDARFPWAADAGDVNGDGTVDVVAAQNPWETGFVLLLNRGDGSFLPPVQYPSPHPSIDLTLGDIDLDGDLDVAVSNTGYNFEGYQVSVFVNDGAGAFPVRRDVAVGTGDHVAPLGVVIEDFDGDLIPDLAVARYGWIGQGTTVALLRGDGQGGFAPPDEFAAGVGPTRLATADLDGDGFKDLAVSNDVWPHAVTLLRNDGTGGFAAPLTLTAPLGVVGGYPTVALADVDGDDDVDLLHSNSGTQVGPLGGERGAVLLYRNQGDGTMGPMESITLLEYTAGPVDLELTDINADGWLDLLAAHASGRAGDGWELALNDGAGSFLPPTLYAAGQTTISVMTGDIDGDLDLDVLTADNYSMEVTVHENRGGATFVVPPAYDTVPISGHLDTGDVDLDGDLDFLTSGGVIYPVVAAVLLNQGDGTFGPYAWFAPPWETSFGKLRDLDGDGYPDALLAGGPPYSFWTARGLGDGTFAPAVEWPVASCGAGDIDAFDLDGDLDLDVVYLEYRGCVSGGGNRVFVSLNRGDGSFDPPVEYEGHLGSYAVIGADLNQDDLIDIAFANYGFYGSEATVSVMLGAGDGTLMPPSHFQTPVGPRDLIAADLNGDQVLDLATCNTGPGTLGIESMSVLLGIGDGNFQPAVTYFGAYSSDLLAVTGITAGDADGDGDLDLMVSNSGANDVSYYENRGDGSFETPMRYGVGKGASDAIFADVTGDGIGDLSALVGYPPSGLDGGVAVVRGLGPATTSTTGPEQAPTHLVLGAAAPNPFRSLTRVAFDQPTAAAVRLRVFDAAGRYVATLEDGPVAAGRHLVTWDGRNESGRALPSGIYFFRLETGERSDTRKVVKVR